MQRTYRLTLNGIINVPESARAALMALGKRRRFADGQFIMHQGDAAKGFFVVTSGQVMVGRYSDDGSLTIFGVAGPGDVFGEVAFFASVPRMSDAVADGAVEVVHIDTATFRKTVVADPKLSLLLIRSLATQVRVLVERLDADRNMTVVDRLAHALLGMQADCDSMIACTHQELADLIGVSRVSLGTALRQLEKTGAIAGGYGKVRIVDRPMLTARLASLERKAQR